MCGASGRDIFNDTQSVLRMQKCACVVLCVVHANCLLQFAWYMSSVNAGRAVRVRALPPGSPGVAGVSLTLTPLAAPHAILPGLSFISSASTSPA